MQLIIPEILAEARGLTWWLILLGLLLGQILWLAGWWSYRFWVALSVTVLAGVIGLYEAPRLDLQPLLAALLLALAAGLLALALMRLVAFAAAGIAFVALMKVIAPSVDSPLVCFLIGGIVATILFRLWIMLLTSLGGALVIGYCSLCLVERLNNVDCVSWSQEHGILLNWLCGAATLFGGVMQFLWYRQRGGKKSGKSDDAGKPAPKPATSGGRVWLPIPFRKAA